VSELELPDLEARELLALFALGLVLGLVLIAITRGVVSEWVIAADIADRRRIREELERWLLEHSPGDDDDQAEPAHEGLTVGSLTGAGERLRIAANTRGGEICQ
jgi:hypothetical protein